MAGRQSVQFPREGCWWWWDVNKYVGVLMRFEWQSLGVGWVC